MLCGGGDKFLICCVISQDRLINHSCDFMGRNCSKLVSTLPSLVAISIVIVEIILF